MLPVESPFRPSREFRLPNLRTGLDHYQDRADVNITRMNDAPPRCPSRTTGTATHRLKSRLMGGFTPQQQAFLAHPPGRSARLIAGPGAGKSYICVAYMETHVKPADGIPHRMRMLTFTRAAAAEFAETMERQGLGGAAPAPSTIHAFALGILRMSAWTGIPQPVRIAVGAAIR